MNVMTTKSNETLQSPEKSPKKSNYLRTKAKRSPSNEHLSPKTSSLDKNITSPRKSESRRNHQKSPENPAPNNKEVHHLFEIFLCTQS